MTMVDFSQLNLKVGFRQYAFMNLIVAYGGAKQYTLAKMLLKELHIPINTARHYVKNSFESLIERGFVLTHRESDRRTRRFEVYYIPTALGITVLPNLVVYGSDN